MNELATTAPTFGPPRWMISFADLMSVILTFFVLLFSMSNPPQNQDDQENKLTGDSEAAFSINQSETPTKIKTAASDQDLSTNYLADVIQNRMESYPELKAAKLEVKDSRLVLSVSAAGFNDAYATNLAQLLKSLDNKIAIYSASLDQSSLVVEKLQEKGFDRNISFFESPGSSSKIDIVIYP